jgi:hypothetical protein
MQELTLKGGLNSGHFSESLDLMESTGKFIG